MSGLRVSISDHFKVDLPPAAINSLVCNLSAKILVIALGPSVVGLTQFFLHDEFLGSTRSRHRRHRQG